VEEPPPQPAVSNDAAATATTVVGMSVRERMKAGFLSIESGESHAESEEERLRACATAGHSPVTVLSRCNPPHGIVSAVKLSRTPDQPILRALFPRPTLRWRLTLLYSVLFLICGAALLAITYEFFIKFAFSYPPKAGGPGGSPANSSLAALDVALSRVRAAYLHRLWSGRGSPSGSWRSCQACLGG
jgi:hypothetical protein